MSDPFDTASRYTCDDDADMLCCDTPMAAIEEWLEGLVCAEDPVVETIRECCPIMVTAWAEQRDSEDYGELTLTAWREFTAEQVEHLMREQRPEWFEVEDG